MTHNGISRRTVLIGGLGLTAAAAVAGGGYGLVEASVLPGKYWIDRVLGACGAPPPPPARALPTRHETRFLSAYRRREVSMVTLIPAGLTSARGLGVVVALHGLGSDAAGTAATLAAAMASAAIPASRARSLAVIAVDGGGTYWHRRADGDDPFEPMAQQLRMRLTRLAGHRPAGGIETGCHDHAFWARNLPAALAFLSPHLA